MLCGVTRCPAYNFMYEKIRKIEITPAQLALGPLFRFGHHH